MAIGFQPMQMPKGPIDPTAIARREEMARALTAQSSGVQNIEHVTQGMAQLAQAMAARRQGNRATKERTQNSQILAEALGSSASGTLSPERLNEIMVLSPELGMQLMEQQRSTEARAAEEQYVREYFPEHLQAWQNGAVTAEQLWNRSNPEPKASEPYTLSAGQKRFDENNQSVAANQQEPFRLLSAGEETEMGLNAENAYQVGPDGKIAQVGGGGVTVNNNLGPSLPGQEAADKAFAPEYVAWRAAGGFSDVDKQLAQLEEAANALESNPGLTGPVQGQVPDAIGVFTNPELINVRDRVLEVAQRNLRLILGAQFAQREGEMLLARAFDPRLSGKENAIRIRRLLTQIRSMAQAKEAASQYFEANGTLVGYAGQTPSFSQIEEVLPPLSGTDQPATPGTDYGDGITVELIQ